MPYLAPPRLTQQCQAVNPELGFQPGDVIGRTRLAVR
jgi:hypothetical protein